MSRFFAFGCSFTSYHWATWADIVGREFEFYENWGANGAGNLFIFNSIIEANIKRKFTSNDTIAVMWSSTVREDTYNQWWEGTGQVRDNHRFSIRGYYLRDLAFMDAIKRVLDGIGCKYYFTSMIPINSISQYWYEPIDDVNDVLPHYSETLDLFHTSVYESIYNLDWHSRKDELRYDPKIPNRIDEHPTPKLHLEYIEKEIPELYNLLTPETINWVLEVANNEDWVEHYGKEVKRW